MVDQSRFEAAQRAYDAGDWRGAAQGFLASAQEGGDDAGRAYVKAATALTRMRRWADAAAVYRHALADPAYATRGSVWANLGMALCEAGEYRESVDAFDQALTDPDYSTPWKALQGRAGALAAMGRHDEAAASYREAALEPGNTDPGKALNNLGLQFMALDRPEDAVQAYGAALDIDGYAGRGRAAANLGVAYVRLGMTEKAAEAFSTADAEGFALDGPFAAARDRVAPRPGPAPVVPAAPRQAQSVAGVGSTPVAPVPGPAERGAGHEPEGREAPAKPPAMTDGAAAPTASEPKADVAETHLSAPDEEDLDTDFFDLTEADMKRIDRERRQAEPVKTRGHRGLWSTVAATVLVLALAAGLAAAALLTGFGFPSQTGVAGDLLSAYQGGKPVEGYWVAVPPVDIDKEMAKIPPTFKAVKTGPVKNTSLNTATVHVAVTIENGSPLDYVIDLQREGVGWRVVGIENDWRSTETTP